MLKTLTIGQLLVVLASVTLVFSSGCQSMSTTTVASNPFKVEKTPKIEFQQPARMAVIWKESSVSPNGEKPTRGFGGRVYFYDSENETVRVDGELTVYAYDDSNTPDGQSRVPDRKYVFRAEDLQRHYSKTGLGESYSVWLPWDKVGGARKTIALVPVFRPMEGLIPEADHSIAVLSGPSPTSEFTEEEEAAADSQVRRASATVLGGENPNAALIGTGMENAVKPNTVRTSTFEMTRSLSNRAKLAIKPKQQSNLRFADKKTATADQAGATNSQNAVHQASPIDAVNNETPPGTRPKRSFGKPGSFR